METAEVDTCSLLVLRMGELIALQGLMELESSMAAIYRVLFPKIPSLVNENNP